MVRKRKQTIGLFMPPPPPPRPALDASGVPLGGTPPSLRITDVLGASKNIVGLKTIKHKPHNKYQFVWHSRFFLYSAEVHKALFPLHAFFPRAWQKKKEKKKHECSFQTIHTSLRGIYSLPRNTACSTATMV